MANMQLDLVGSKQKLQNFVGETPLDEGIILEQLTINPFSLRSRARTIKPNLLRGFLISTIALISINIFSAIFYKTKHKEILSLLKTDVIISISAVATLTIIRAIVHHCFYYSSQKSYKLETQDVI